MPIQPSENNGKISAPTKVFACPVELAIHVIGGKWKLLLLRSLLLNGPQGYNQLLSSVTGISAKELTRNLGELTASGLIVRHPETGGRTIPYLLTPVGEGLMPTFQTLLTWGKALLPPASTNPSVR